MKNFPPLVDSDQKEVFIMTEDLEIFNTPRLQYLSMRRNFLAKFLNMKSLGEFGSEGQLLAVSCLLDYFEETRSLACQHPQPV